MITLVVQRVLSGCVVMLAGFDRDPAVQQQLQDKLTIMGAR